MQKNVERNTTLSKKIDGWVSLIMSVKDIFAQSAKNNVPYDHKCYIQPIIVKQKELDCFDDEEIEYGAEEELIREVEKTEEENLDRLIQLMDSEMKESQQGKTFR